MENNTQVPTAQRGNDFSSPTAETRALKMLETVQKKMTVAAPVTPAPEVVPEPPKVIDAKPPEVATKYEIDPPKPEAPKILTEEDFVPDEPGEELDKEINFKNLRTKLKTTNKTLKEKEEALKTASKKLEEYESGLTMPEYMSQRLARIEDLERIEEIHNLKGSPAYREKVLLPIAEQETKLGELAAGYNIDPNTLKAALEAPNVAEQNRILSQAFKDDVGALEAKSIFNSIKKIQNDALELEKKPKAALARIQEETRRIEESRRQAANEGIVHASKDAWREALQTLKEDPRFPALVYREGDTEHNEIVREILTRAGQEYGKMVKGMADAGATVLPKDLGVAMARLNQMAHQAAILAIELDKSKQRTAELERQMGIRMTTDRPSLHSNGTGTTSSAPSNGSHMPRSSGGAKHLEDRGMALLNQVTGRR